MFVVTQPPGTDTVPRTPARPLSETRYSLEWPHDLSRAWWAANTAHDAYAELLALTDEQGAATSPELLDLLRVARDHWAAVERWALPIRQRWIHEQSRPDVADAG
jgi:hypothetical protein